MGASTTPSPSSAELQRREDERTDAFVVVRDDGLVDVVLEGPVAIRIATESRDRTDAIERDGSVGVLADEPPHEAIERASGRLTIARLQITHARALRERIGEHAGGGRLEIVGRGAWLVHGLEP